MRVIAFIENEDTINKILKHLGLWDVNRKPLPKAHAPPYNESPSYNDAIQPRSEDYIVDLNIPLNLIFNKIRLRTSRIGSSKFCQNPLVAF